MTDNNININNNTDDEVPEPTHVCEISDQQMFESDMRQVPADNHHQYIYQRRTMWLERNSRLDIPLSESECSWVPRMVWIDSNIEHGYCEDCGVLLEAEMLEERADMEMCPNCAENWYWCGDHDIYYHCENGCDYCADEEDEGSRLIHDYSYRPNPVFYLPSSTVMREPRNMTVTGFELEMEAVGGRLDEAAQLATDEFPQAYLKYDGSISHGFEMVTHPMSLDYINSEFNFDALKDLADLGMRSAKTTTCGLHVHINKGFFRSAPSTSYRFMSLFYSNAEAWRRLAGRSHSSYAQWDIGEDTRLLGYTKGIRDNDTFAVNRDRYVALNLQPSKTIELRFFKGTLRPLTLRARLQAVHAAAEYAMSTRYKVKVRDASSWEAFRNFTTDNDKKYSAFNEYATEKGV